MVPPFLKLTPATCCSLSGLRAEAPAWQVPGYRGFFLVTRALGSGVPGPLTHWGWAWPTQQTCLTQGQAPAHVWLLFSRAGALAGPPMPLPCTPQCPPCWRGSAHISGGETGVPFQGGAPSEEKTALFLPAVEQHRDKKGEGGEAQKKGAQQGRPGSPSSRDTTGGCSEREGSSCTTLSSSGGLNSHKKAMRRAKATSHTEL